MILGGCVLSQEHQRISSSGTLNYMVYTLNFNFFSTIIVYFSGVGMCNMLLSFFLLCEL